ncbi:SRPBCC family protein [Mesorhizobium sp.]|uniref:SRPBCC family protein n=1 Tax=Mesorhizobium sp. TaxID=1871066 RepID=UPI0025C05087|nr:SRPBCC family protein [Mesorhizobium sp.]
MTTNSRDVGWSISGASLHRRPCRLCQDRAAGAARSEQTELTAEWLFSPEALADPTADIDNIVAFGRQVLEEDADICEINQKGLRSMRHKAGVLMPEEYEIASLPQLGARTARNASA